MGNHLPKFLMLLDGVLTDVTSDVRQTSPLKIDWGSSVISDDPKPGTLEFTFHDMAGKYRVHDPRSSLYGRAGRNTPLYVADVIAFEDFEDTSYVTTIGDGGGDLPWARSTTSPHSGSWCFKSGAISSSQRSTAAIDAPAGANLAAFWYRTDCDASQVMTFASGGVIRATATGTGGSWAQMILPMATNDSALAQQAYISYIKNTATVGGADAVYIDDLTFYRCRAATEITSWQPDQSVGFDATTGRGDRTCDVHAEGVLGRIGSWTEPLDSAMTRSISRLYGVLAHWTGEDGDDAVQMTNRVPGGAPARIAGTFSFGVDGPAGSATAMQINSDTRIGGQFATATATGWIFGFTMKLPAVPGSATSLPMIQWTTDNNYTWSLTINNASRTLSVVDATGASLLTTAMGIAANEEPDGQVALTVTATASGGTVFYTVSRIREFATTAAINGGSFTGSAGRLSGWSLMGNAYLSGGTLCQVFGSQDATQTLIPTGSYAASLSGYAGERAAARGLRLCNEEGMTFLKFGRTNDTPPMGPQRPNTFLTLLKQIRDTDGGLLNSAAGGIAVEYRTRIWLYNRPIALALTFGMNVAPPLQPILDNQGAWNQVVAQQENGGSYTAGDTTSSMGSAPPPAGIGLVKKTISVSLQDETGLGDIAAWWLNVGTAPGARYSSVTVDPDASPSLESTASAMSPGDRITITGLDPDVIDLMVIGVKDNQDNQKRRLITFDCLPYGPWAVGVLNTERLDARSTTLSAGITSTATSLTLKMTDVNEQWRTGSNSVPVRIGGELMTLGTVGAVTGSGPWTQAVTGCTRGVNGFTKAHNAGDPVTVNDTIRLILKEG